jgi:hypothetical protein
MVEFSFPVALLQNRDDSSAASLPKTGPPFCPDSAFENLLVWEASKDIGPTKSIKEYRRHTDGLDFQQKFAFCWDGSSSLGTALARFRSQSF